MMTPGRLDSIKIPEKPTEPKASAGAGVKPEEKRADLPDFDSLLSSSNAEKQKEVEQEKAAAGGDLLVGETKSDKEFRQMLEKISGKKQDKLKNKLEKDDYLNLMVTQLKYQDPTKPMDNQEMATQLAQFNTVEQLMAANKTLGEMKTQNGAANVDKLAPYLGKNVDVAGNRLTVKPDRAITEASLRLPASASAVSVQVKDSSGTVVRTLALGDLQAGSHRVPFDGKDDKGHTLPSGQYTFGVNAASVDGKPIEATTFMSVRVDGIVDLAGGGKLETAGGPVDVKDIVAIRAPEAAAPAAAQTTVAAQTAVAPPTAALATAPAVAAPTALTAATPPAAPAAPAPGAAAPAAPRVATAPEGAAPKRMKPDTKPDTKPEPKPDAKGEVKPDPKPSATAESKPAPKSQPKAA